MPETIAEPRLSKAAPALAGHLDRVRRRQCGVALHTGIAMALAALLAWLAIEMPLDWLLALHVTVRAAILVWRRRRGGACVDFWIPSVAAPARR